MKTTTATPEKDAKSSDVPVVERSAGEHVVLNYNFDPTLTKDLGEGIIEATITSGAVDHHNERINMDGVDVSAYHGTVLYGHDYESLPIGKTLGLEKMKNKIKAKFQLAIEEYPFANTIYKLIKGGYLTDVSIGGLVKRWSEDYTVIEEMVMKEFSLVPIGANKDATITAFKALGVNSQEVKREYQDFARSVLLDKLKGMPEDDLKDAIKVLRNLVARLEETANMPSLSDDKPQTRIIKYRVLEDAKAVATQSQRVIKTVKLKF